MPNGAHMTSSTDGTWLPIRDAAKAGNLTEKALRRRVERGTVDSELRDDGRRYVRVQSITDEHPAPPPNGRGPRDGALLEPLMRRLEELSVENGRLRALTQVAESTERRLADELHEQRARAQAAESRTAELEGLERALTDAGPIRAWRLARQRRAA